MIKELNIKNFRSIREASLELGRFTVLNGANNSGKSSVLYALQVLKNVVTDPNRSVDELLNLGFLNLGGLKEVSFQRNESLIFDLSIRVEHWIVEKYDCEFGVLMSKPIKGLKIRGLAPYIFENTMTVSFPYSLNKESEIEMGGDLKGWKAIWNGIQIKEIENQRGEILDIKGSGSLSLNFQASIPIEALFQLDLTPTIRGFYKPYFNVTPINGVVISEDQVATLLAIDKELQAKVALYFEKITGKRFSIVTTPGMGFFYMQVREADGAFATELVNQGMGINQIIFLLTKILYKQNRLICIDEPEIHLHPTMIEQFVKVLVEIAHKEGKQFLFSTHSEHWLMSMLAEVNDENIEAEDLKVYYLYKVGQETKIEGQRVYPNGQIEGGLRNFLDAEMRLSERFLLV